MMMPFPDEGPRDENRPLNPKAPSLDDRLARQLSDKLRADPHLGRRHVRVDVQNGVALLTGTVDSPDVAESAVLVARSTDGIRDVCNAMRLPESDILNPAPRAGADPQNAGGTESGNVVSFEAIAAKLMADHPSLRDRPRLPRSRSARILLAVAGAIMWGLFCVMLAMLLN